MGHVCILGLEGWCVGGLTVMANLDPFDWLEMGAWCLYVSGISCAKSELKTGDPV